MHKFNAALTFIIANIRRSSIIHRFNTFNGLFLYFLILADFLIKNLKGVIWDLLFKNAVTHISQVLTIFVRHLTILIVLLRPFMKTVL